MRLDRRGFISQATMVAATALWACARRGEEAGLAVEELKLVSRVCDLTIPTTDTPGALAAGVPDFVSLAVAKGIDGTTADMVGLLGIELSARAGGPFTTVPAVRQGAALARLDREALAASPISEGARGRGADDQAGAISGPAAAMPAPNLVWPKIKGLILMGYYTSDIGGSRELTYELVPGRWDANIPLKPGDRALSNDWTAVRFG